MEKNHRRIRIALIGSDRLHKIKEPLESVDVECEVVRGVKDVVKKVDAIIVDIAGLRIFLGWLIKQIYKAKLIYRGRGFFLRELPLFKGSIVSALIKLCDCSIFVSQNLRKEVSTQLNLSKSFVVGTPVQLLSQKQRKRRVFTVITLTNMNFLN